MHITYLMHITSGCLHITLALFHGPYRISWRSYYYFWDCYGLLLRLLNEICDATCRVFNFFCFFVENYVSCWNRNRAESRSLRCTHVWRTWIFQLWLNTCSDDVAWRVSSEIRRKSGNSKKKKLQAPPEYCEVRSILRSFRQSRNPGKSRNFRRFLSGGKRRNPGRTDWKPFCLVAELLQDVNQHLLTNQNG